MPYPLKSKFTKGDRIKLITSGWYNWIANFFNKSTWEGITFKPTASGVGCIIKITLDDATLEFDADKVTIKLKDGGITAAKIATDAIETIKIKNDAVTTGKIADDAVDKDKIAADVAGSGLTQAVGGDLAVSVDDSTIGISGDAISVKDGGIDSLQLADNAANSDKTTGATGTYAMGVPGSTLNFTNGLLTSVT